MGKTIMGVAAVSLDGFIADDKDDPPGADGLGARRDRAVHVRRRRGEGDRRRQGVRRRP
jgi:hypothetical protein